MHVVYVDRLCSVHVCTIVGKGTLSLTLKVSVCELLTTVWPGISNSCIDHMTTMALSLWSECRPSIGCLSIAIICCTVCSLIPRPHLSWGKGSGLVCMGKELGPCDVLTEGICLCESTLSLRLLHNSAVSVWIAHAAALINQTVHCSTCKLWKFISPLSIWRWGLGNETLLYINQRTVDSGY